MSESRKDLIYEAILNRISTKPLRTKRTLAYLKNRKIQIAFMEFRQGLTSQNMKGNRFFLKLWIFFGVYQNMSLEGFKQDS